MRRCSRRDCVCECVFCVCTKKCRECFVGLNKQCYCRTSQRSATLKAFLSVSALRSCISDNSETTYKTRLSVRFHTHTQLSRLAGALRAATTVRMSVYSHCLSNRACSCLSESDSQLQTSDKQILKQAVSFCQFQFHRASRKCCLWCASKLERVRVCLTRFDVVLEPCRKLFQNFCRTVGEFF